MAQTGIYVITNKINGKKYVGQSVDIARRYSEHLRSAQPEKYSLKNIRDSKTPIHLAMQKYGIENFTLEILELCNKQELNEKEKFWIQNLETNHKDKGYNITSGGQDDFQLTGENHSQAKLTRAEVEQIKILLKENQISLTEINKLYPQISKSLISMINQGKVWKSTTDTYPLRPTYYGQPGEKNPVAKLTEKDAIAIREMQSQGQTIKTVAKLYPQVTERAIKAVFYGETFKHLPVWDNKNKKWK